MTASPFIRALSAGAAMFMSALMISFATAPLPAALLLGNVAHIVA